MDFPPAYTKLKECERPINETRELEWMDATIKLKESNISNDDRPELEKIRDCQSDQQTIEIINLLREYQDVFARDYKEIKGLVEEMGEMKIDLLPKAKPIKKQPYELAHK